MNEPILLEKEGTVAVLTLNRPETHNTIDLEMLKALRTHVDELKSATDIRVVILTGTGRFFCSGANLTGMGNLLSEDGPKGAAGVREAARQIYQSGLCLLELEVPVIAAINGHAVGGGLAVSLACDIRIVAEDAKLGANFVRIGLHPGLAVTYFLPRVVGFARAAELLFTGRIFRGNEAVEMGLATEAVPADDVRKRAKEIAAEIAEAAPYAVRLTKQSLRRSIDFDPQRALEMESYAQALTVETEDFAEGVAAFIQKRKPVFKGK